MRKTSKHSVMNRRGFLKAGVVGAAGLVAASCAPPPAPQQVVVTQLVPGEVVEKIVEVEVQITSAPVVLTKPFAGKTLNMMSANHHDENIRDLWIPLFEEKTGAKVAYTSIGGGDADAKYAVFLASQDASQDVMYSWETFNAKYGPGMFEDLTTLFSKDFYEKLAAAPVKAFQFLGKQYGIPFDANMAIFLWNTELYKSAGLDPEKPPENWDQFAEFSKKLTGGGKYGTLFTLGDGNSSFFTFITIFNSSGALLLSDDQKTLQMDTPEGLLALTKFYDGVVVDKFIDPAGLTINSSIEQGKVFRAGNMGHYFGFPNHYKLSQDPLQSKVMGKVKSGIIPGIKLRSGSGNGFEGFSMNKNSPSKELAMAWLEYIVSPEVQKWIALKWGRPPSLMSTFNDPLVQSVAPQFAAVVEQAKYPAPRYGSPFYFDLGTVFNDNMNVMLKGKLTPQEAATKIQVEGQAVIDAYWQKVA